MVNVQDNILGIQKVYKYYRDLVKLPHRFDIFNRDTNAPDDQHKLFYPTFNSCTDNLLKGTSYELYVTGSSPEQQLSSGDSTIILLHNDSVLFYMNCVDYTNRYSKITVSGVEINGSSEDKKLYLYDTENTKKNGEVPFDDEIDDSWWFQNLIRFNLPMYEEGLILKQYYDGLIDDVHRVNDSVVPFYEQSSIYNKGRFHNIVISTLMCNHNLVLDEIDQFHSEADILIGRHKRFIENEERILKELNRKIQ